MKTSISKAFVVIIFLWSTAGSLSWATADYVLVGDCNLDGTITLMDVQPFVDLISNNEYLLEADCNYDGAVDLRDVDSFLAILDSRPEADVVCLRGDVNQDGVINLLDVEPFVDRLMTDEFQCEADINGDGTIDLLDVEPFVQLLAGQSPVAR